MLAVSWPFGCLRGSPPPAAGKLATLKQCPPFLRCRLHGSAMPPGQGNLKGNVNERATRSDSRRRMSDQQCRSDGKVFRCRGFDPGRRGPFVSAKGPKTIDAPSGFIEEEGRELFKERPNSPGSDKVRQMRRASLLWASRQASEQNQRVPSQTQEGGPIRGDYPGPTQKGLTTARLFSGTDCTARPYHQAREI